jgi:hypothetical protein
MKTLIAVTTLACWAGPAAAQRSIRDNLLFDPGANTIDVYVRPASLPGWNDKSKWTVIAFYISGSFQAIALRNIRADSARSMFTLVPDDTSPSAPVAAASHLVVRFGAKDLVIYKLPVKSASRESTPIGLGPATSQKSADLYLNGTYSMAKASAPLYQISGSVALMKQVHGLHGQVGVVGSVTTDKRKRVDPDSYRFFTAYQRSLSSRWDGALQGVLLTWMAAGAESDREANNLNFVSAPYLDFPVRLFPGFIYANTEPIAVLTPTLGVEVGYNSKNAVTFSAGRGIARAVGGASLLIRFDPRLPVFKGVELSGSYTLRWPLISEVSTSTATIAGKSVDISHLSKTARAYRTVELDFKLSDPLSLAVKHEYGALPPAFRRVSNKLSVGFTLSVRQTRGGLPSAVRNR